MKGEETARSHVASATDAAAAADMPQLALILIL